MKEIAIKELNENFIESIAKEWMLITAGTKDSFNMMTASWGGVGYLWNKPVAFVFIRPERYTFGFSEAQEHLTLTFLGKEHRSIYNFCGSKSGRDFDKVKETGLKPIVLADDIITYEQARLTISCRKLYADDLHAENFLDKEALKRWYNDEPGGSLHKVYVVEIEHAYI